MKELSVVERNFLENKHFYYVFNNLNTLKNAGLMDLILV